MVWARIRTASASDGCKLLTSSPCYVQGMLLLPDLPRLPAAVPVQAFKVSAAGSMQCITWLNWKQPVQTCQRPLPSTAVKAVLVGMQVWRAEAV